MKFNAEPVGRYGALIADADAPGAENPIDVGVVTIDRVLSDVLDREDRIDILKIDTEGAEVPTIAVASAELLEQVDVIYLEASPSSAYVPSWPSASGAKSACPRRLNLSPRPLPAQPRRRTPPPSLPPPSPLLAAEPGQPRNLPASGRDRPRLRLGLCPGDDQRIPHSRDGMSRACAQVRAPGGGGSTSASSASEPSFDSPTARRRRR